MSPCLVKILTPAGLEPAPYTADSLADAARHEPDGGVYTVTNTYNTYDTLMLDAHFDRLEDSARRAGIGLHLDRGRVRAALRDMIDEAAYGDVRFRVTVPREHPDHYILTIEPFTPPVPELIASGVRCVTLKDSARHDAAVKGTDWMHRRAELAASRPEGVYETILLDENGALLEGMTSNFYALLADELYTAAAGILPGIAQQLVLEVAPQIIPVRRAALNVRDLECIEEAFITSSSRGVIPVVEIDGVRIGAGVPGTVTERIRAAYNARLRELLQPL